MELIANDRQAIQQTHDQSRESLVVIGGLRLEARLLADLTEVQCTADEKAALLGQDIRAFDFTGIGQLTGDGFEDVGHGEQSHEITEFVHHKSDVRRLLTHLFQRVENGETVQQVDCLAGHGFQIRLVPRQQFLEQFLLVDETQRLIDLTIKNQRQPGVRRVHQPRADHVWGIGQVEVIDFRAGSHDPAYRAFRQLKHTADHDPFAAVERRFDLIACEHIGDLFTHLVGIQRMATQQTHHCMGGTLAHGAAALQALLAA